MDAFPTTSCLTETGFSAAELMAFFTLCMYDLPDRLIGPEYANMRYFYLLFLYFQFMPTAQSWAKVMHTKLGGPCSIWSFRNNSIPIAECIAKYTHAIQYSDRLHKRNHHPLMPYFITGIVDGFPVFVSTPKDPEAFRLLNAGKYKATCYRYEMLCDLTGHILHVHGPELGCRNDARTRKNAENDTPMHPQERFIGDRAYRASKQVLTAYIKPNGGELTQAQRAFNFQFNSVRQRVLPNIGSNLSVADSWLFCRWKLSSAMSKTAPFSARISVGLPGTSTREHQ
jgi:hypothetical protein